ncbi:hypothetical protein UlMin_042216 [Ulmus minor]
MGPPTLVPTRMPTPEALKSQQTPMLLPVPTSRTPPAQMVCGSSHRLFKYSPGATRVQCSCCQIVNHVLEAHQVGVVKCGSCTTFLMYPYGAPSARCSSCQFVMEIGAHNQRPLWLVLQG